MDIEANPEYDPDLTLVSRSTKLIKATTTLGIILPILAIAFLVAGATRFPETPVWRPEKQAPKLQPEREQMPTVSVPRLVALVPKPKTSGNIKSQVEILARNIKQDTKDPEKLKLWVKLRNNGTRLVLRPKVKIALICEDNRFPVEIEDTHACPTFFDLEPGKNRGTYWTLRLRPEGTTYNRALTPSVVTK